MLYEAYQTFPIDTEVFKRSDGCLGASDWKRYQVVGASRVDDAAPDAFCAFER